MDTSAKEFNAPGPGQWALDRSHYPGGTTPISQELLTETMAAGMSRVFAEIGVPAKCVEARFVHGFMYTRLTPLIAGDRPTTKLPPAPLLKLAARSHPEFRRRTRAAERALAERPSLEVVARWQQEMRPRLAGINRAFQAVDLSRLTDIELRDHLVALIDHVGTSYELHFWLHGHDLGPIARYLHHAVGCNLDPAETLSLLGGASPSTTVPAERLVRLRAAIDAAGADPHTLDEVRDASPEAAQLLDEHLAALGHVMVTGYDLTALTLGELPGLILDNIRTATPVSAADNVAVEQRLRDQLSASDRQLFEEYLADARTVMDMRDDNGPMTVEWPLGLLRMAMLEAGRRLARSGSLSEPEHVIELTRTELLAFPNISVSADAIGKRRASRLADAELDPPEVLGPAEPEPDLDVLPAPLAELVGAVNTALEHLGMAGDTAPAQDPLLGVGIGTNAVTAPARCVSDAADAFENLQPGEVLVVRATSPAYNAVLMMAGAVVTADGGALSHAAVLARELGIPAVVGAPGALDIPNGALLRVDPVAGRVSVVDGESAPADVS